MIGSQHTPETPEDKRVWRLPNGRYIFFDAGTYSVQPPDDNWWHASTSLAEAIAWFEELYQHQAIPIGQAVEICATWGAARGHSAPALRAACASGDLPAELRGKTWYIRVAALREWAQV